MTPDRMRPRRAESVHLPPPSMPLAAQIQTPIVHVLAPSPRPAGRPSRVLCWLEIRRWMEMRAGLQQGYIRWLEGANRQH